jgi:glyoxalase family protein
VKSTEASRFGVDRIVVEDPDGIEIELAGEGVDDRWAPWRDGPVEVEHAIRGFHSVTLTIAEARPTFDLLVRTMGFRQSEQEGSRTRFETGPGGPDSIVEVVESPEGPVGDESVGTVHHVAWRAADDSHQLAWRDVLVGAGFNVTPVIDRWYFKSIYYREPGGVLFEIATDGPGFTVDEAPESLGTSLSLPPWFQVRRDRLDVTLPPIAVPTTTATRAGH